MNNLLAFSNVLQISGVTAVLFGAFLIAALGYLVGAIKIKGVSLGTAGVFLVAIAFGVIFAIPGLVEIDFLNNFYLIGDSEVYKKLTIDLLDEKILKTLATSHANTEVYGTLADVGLILFVTSVGFIAGPNFFKNLRANAKSYVLLGVIIVLSGVTVAILFAIIPGIGTEYSIGVLSGALTSTPAFSAAKEVASDEALVALGHAVAYPFGVVGVVLFVQLMPKFLKANREEEVAKMQSVSTGEAKIERESQKLFEIDEFGLAIFGLAVVLGLTLGKLTLTISGLKFNLGSTGGPLIAALILGHFGKIGKISLKVPEKTLKVFREFGLVLFLIGAGVEGGVSLLEKINAGTFDGLTILWGFLAGAVMTIVPMFVGFFFAKKVLKLPLFNNLGSITGGMTSTPALGTLVQVSGTDDVAGAYASTYPIALVLIVIASNLVITLLGPLVG